MGRMYLSAEKSAYTAPKKISIGHDVRIDDFCILSGKIEIGNYIHIGAYCALYAGDFGIVMRDFSDMYLRAFILRKVLR